MNKNKNGNGNENENKIDTLQNVFRKKISIMYMLVCLLIVHVVLLVVDSFALQITIMSR